MALPVTHKLKRDGALVPDAPPTAGEHMAATPAVNVAGSDHNPFLVVPVEGAAASGAVYVLDVNGSATRTANVHITTVPTAIVRTPDPRSMRSPGRHHEPALAAPMVPTVGSVAMASGEHDELGPVPVMVMAIVRANVNNANVRALDNIDMYRPHMYRLHNMMGVVIRQRQAAAVASYAHRRRNKSQANTYPTDHHRQILHIPSTAPQPN